MARNRKPEYIEKLINTQAPNGYKFDLANYLYNPSYQYDYPSFIKVIDEDETTETIRRVYYFKYYNGEGEYIGEIFIRQKNHNGWQIITNSKDRVLEKSNRFSSSKLLTFCA